MDISKLVFSALFLMLFGFSLTPLSIKVAGRYGIMDFPSPRKDHSRPIPRGAGLIVWGGYLMWSLLYGPLTFDTALLATGGTVVFFVGYLDDMSPLKPVVRLMVHFLAASLVVLPFSKASPAFIVLGILWVAGCTNAYNIIDGMNGLSLSMAMIAFGSLALAGERSASIPMMGLCAGVMIWNYPKAYTFMGDGGVYLLGYVVSALTLWKVSPSLTGNPIASAFILALLGGVPVFDTLLAILRRLLSHKSPFSPDRGHVHHRLHDMGWSQNSILLFLALSQALLLWAGFAFSAFILG